ncbi:MAG: sugar ABC transporter permease [Spirochaetia bacterium]|nr:sugar ABC transporter permease [Spirochaetia bacterium]
MPSLQQVNRNSREALLMILPSFLGLIIFSVYTIGYVLALSFTRRIGGQTVFIGFDHYVRLFTRDPNYWTAVANTFIISGKLLIELPLALILAVLLNRKMRSANVFRVIIFMPYILSAVIIGLIFSFLFASYEGIVNNLLMDMHLITTPINWFGTRAHALAVIIIASVWQCVGINMVFFLTALQSISPELYESAAIDGAGTRTQFFHITLPMLKRMTKVITLLAIIGTLKSADLALVLTNGAPGGRSENMMTFVFKYFFSQGARAPQIGYSAAAGTVSALIIGLITIAYLLLTRKEDSV